MRIALLIILLMLIIATCACTTNMPQMMFFARECMVVSDVDKEPYTVREDYENKQQAANILGSINAMYVRLIKHLKQNHMHGIWGKNITYLANNYNPDVLGEHIPWSTDYTSYVRNKGTKIRMCLRTAKDRNKFHDMNTLRFVALHELSHMMTTTYGHKKDFWEAFKFILIEASKIGEIQLVRYKDAPQPYCGISITSNPAFDDK